MTSPSHRFDVTDPYSRISERVSQKLRHLGNTGSDCLDNPPEKTISPTSCWPIGPAPTPRPNSFFPPTAAAQADKSWLLFVPVDNVYGDRHLACAVDRARGLPAGTGDVRQPRAKLLTGREHEPDRFCEALIVISNEIRAIEAGTADRRTTPSSALPRTADLLLADCTRPYPRRRPSSPPPPLRPTSTDRRWLVVSRRYLYEVYRTFRSTPLSGYPLRTLSYTGRIKCRAASFSVSILWRFLANPTGEKNECARRAGAGSTERMGGNQAKGPNVNQEVDRGSVVR